MDGCSIQIRKAAEMVAGSHEIVSRRKSGKPAAMPYPLPVRPELSGPKRLGLAFHRQPQVVKPGLQFDDLVNFQRVMLLGGKGEFGIRIGDLLRFDRQAGHHPRAVVQYRELENGQGVHGGLQPAVEPDIPAPRSGEGFQQGGIDLQIGGRGLVEAFFEFRIGDKRLPGIPLGRRFFNGCFSGLHNQRILGFDSVRCRTSRILRNKKSGGFRFF